MITIQELLFNRGLDKKSRTKLVRHKATQTDLYNLYRTDKKKFLQYQSQQGKDIFHGVDFIVSFIGEAGTLSRFIGVFKVLRAKKLAEKKPSVDGGLYQFEYEMEEISDFDDLKERVIIDWGKGAIKWEQWLNNDKEVVEIQPGLHYQQFTDFEFTLDFMQLKEIATKQYPDWKRMLSATKGIYLINDTKTGKLYIGSAYGEDGIWGRWCAYASTNGHGGNKTLQELVRGDENYAYNFQFSILRLLPKTVTADQAISEEKLFKKKLGTNSFGLNNN
ncbi:MAG TPA: GIY-YIG nuclease family protein [Chitinophagales bacterium]|nr:GIY-YIG nuclease family protein [Chitinophagales bacterium]